MGRQTEIHAERTRCPIYTALNVIGGRWKPMICGRLRLGATTFGSLLRAMPGITTKVLREQLAQLVADGVIARKVSAGPPTRVSYSLTSHGSTLGPVFETLWSWGTTHLAVIDGMSPDAEDTSIDDE